MKKYSLIALIFGSGLALGGTALAGAGKADDSGKAADDSHECGGKGKGEGRMNRLDTDKDGKVTLAELTAARESWLTKFDANKDGTVTQAELEAGRGAAHAERAARIIAQQDTNKDGRLTREESKLPERWFANADVNKDGVLTQAELSAAPKREGHGPRGQMGGKMFGHLDANKDGKIERAEVQKAAANMLQRLDQNKDGVLSGDELRGPGRHHGGFHHGPAGGHDQGQPGAAPAPRT